MFRTQRRAAFALLVLGHSLLGCRESQLVSAPTPARVLTPTPIPAPTPAASVLLDVTLFGTVYEIVGDSPNHRRGIEGASVYCEPCGQSTHNWAYTDINGDYVFPRGVWNEGRESFPTRVYVAKNGYRDPSGLPNTSPPNPSGPGWREVLITGDTRFDMELVAR